MIVPVIEHMEKMNSRSTTARLINNLADKSTNLVNNNSLTNETTSSTSTATTTILNNSVNQNDSNISHLHQTSITSSSLSSQLSIKDILHNGTRLRKNSLNQIEDIEMINESTNINNDLNKTNNEDKNLNQQQQQTFIIEGGLNGLQFQLKPEINQNRHITLKVVPISPSTPNNSSNFLPDQSSTLKQNNLNSNQAILNGKSQTPRSETLNDVNFLDDKNQSNENLNLNNSSSNQTAATTTVNLSESNQSVYFMMQPIDLLTSSLQTNQTIKLKTQNTPSVSPLNKSYSPTHLQTTPLTNINLQNIPNSTQQITPGYNSTILPNTTTVTLTPISSSSSVNSSPNAPKVVRDERRRANHNEVERRRRDNINKWIVELSKVIPDCSNDQSKHGQSKGGILEKTVQYLLDIKKTNQQLNDHLKSFEKLKQENELLKQQNEHLRKENQIFKMKLGIENSDLKSVNSNNNPIE